MMRRGRPWRARSGCKARLKAAPSPASALSAHGFLRQHETRRRVLQRIMDISSAFARADTSTALDSTGDRCDEWMSFARARPARNGPIVASWSRSSSPGGQGAARAPAAYDLAAQCRDSSGGRDDSSASARRAGSRRVTVNDRIVTSRCVDRHAPGYIELTGDGDGTPRAPTRGDSMQRYSGVRSRCQGDRHQSGSRLDCKLDGVEMTSRSLPASS